MSTVASDYEKMGEFYLGREYDMGAKKLDQELVLYDSKDLVTHGVVLGMTGSGKTGLCFALLEEAAMDNIPAIVIDPKGDIANLMLNFPEQVEGKRVLDPFAGSGVLGLMALKQGAARVEFVDLSARAVAFQEENVRLNGFEAHRCACR